MNIAEAYVAALVAQRNCARPGFENPEWAARWNDRIVQLQKMLPHGAGLDGAVEFDNMVSTDNRIVIHAEYHHMNDVGYYDGWSNYRIAARSTFMGIDLRIMRGREDAKDYLADVFLEALRQEAPPFPWQKEVANDQQDR